MIQDRVYCPPSVIDNCERELTTQLTSWVRLQQAHRFFLSFASRDGSFQFRSSFLTDPSWKILFTNVRQGLMGAALKSGEIEIWERKDVSPVADGVEDERYLLADPRTVLEVSFPIFFGGKATGVVLVDFFENEELIGILELKDRAKQWQRELDTILSKPKNEIANVRSDIYQAVFECVRETKSLRGYYAAQSWDGRLEYFACGKDFESFLPLNLDEGICGESFLTGNTINEGNVWSHSAYLPSDETILSEFVIPITSDGRTVGILNMESREQNHYNERFVDLIEQTAGILRSKAQLFQETPNYQGANVISAIVELTSTICCANLPEISIKNYENYKAWALEKLGKSLSLISPNSAIETLNLYSAENLDVDWTEQFKRILGSKSDFYQNAIKDEWETVFALKVKGEIEAFVRIISNEPLDEMAETGIRLLLRFVANELRRRENEFSSNNLNRTIVEIMECTSWPELSFNLSELLSGYLQADSTVIFTNVAIGSSNTYVPLSSSGSRINNAPKSEFYDIAQSNSALEEDVLAGEIICIENFRSMDLAESADVLISKLDTSEKNDVRSLLIIPVSHDQHLIGYVRCIRAVSGMNSSFVCRDLERARVVQFLIECALSSPVGALNEFLGKPDVKPSLDKTTHH